MKVGEVMTKQVAPCDFETNSVQVVELMEECLGSLQVAGEGRR
jgi:hypothetical protein